MDEIGSYFHGENQCWNKAEFVKFCVWNFPEFWFTTTALRYHLFMSNPHQSLHTHQQGVYICMCSGIIVISVKLAELERIKNGDFSRKSHSQKITKLAFFNHQVSP